MFEATGTAVIAAGPDEILDWVADLERYALADTKIRRVGPPEQTGDVTRRTHGGQLRGIPNPTMGSTLTLDPGQGLEVVGHNALLDFEGTFSCRPAEDGTEVTHTERYRFRGPLRVLEPFFRGWLARDIREEMARLKTLIEAGEPPR